MRRIIVELHNHIINICLLGENKFYLEVSVYTYNIRFVNSWNNKIDLFLCFSGNFFHKYFEDLYSLYVVQGENSNI